MEDSTQLDLGDFDLSTHAGVLLDGVGDTLFLKRNREVLQGRPKVCKGGKSGTMMYAYPYTLCRRAVVATFDLSASNLELLQTDHWLSDSRNVMQLRLGMGIRSGGDTGLAGFAAFSRADGCLGGRPACRFPHDQRLAWAG